MAISSLLVPGVNIPQPDNSWLSSIADSIGGAITNVRADRSFTGLADRLQGGASAPQQPAGGFLSSLAGPRQQPAQTASRGVAGGPIDPAIKDGIMKTANALGINPADLATAISYETAGTFDPTKSGPTTQWGQHRGLIQFGEPQAQKYGVNWEDPIGSQLGENGAVANYLRDTGVKPGMGLMDIYSAINAGGVGRYDRSDANNGGAPGTVADKVNSQMAGHIARARALFGDAAAPASAAAAVTAMGEGGSLASAFSGEGQAPRAPMQVADSSGASGLIAQGVTPVQRGSVDPSIIQYMLRDRNLRDVGLKLWAANAEGQKAGEPWQFVNLPDGTLARANQQTGAVERLGNFAKPNEDATVVGENLVRRSTGEVIYEGKPKTPASYQEFKLAQQEGFKGTYADWEKVKTPGTSVTVNNQDQGEFSKKAAARNVERFGNLADAGTSAASVAQSMPVLRELLTQAPQGPVQGRIAEMFPGFNTAGDAFIAQVNQIAPTLRVPGSGAMSDKDMDILMSSLPRLRSDPAANQLILNVFERKAQLNADRGAIAAQALRGEVSPEEADRRISEIDKTPLLDERSRSMLQNGQGGGVAKPQTKADFDALKSGDLYIDPDDNQTYRKR
jgi:hypothetical protein